MMSFMGIIIISRSYCEVQIISQMKETKGMYIINFIILVIVMRKVVRGLG